MIRPIIGRLLKLVTVIGSLIAIINSSHKSAVGDTLGVAVTTPATFELSCNIVGLCASYLPKIGSLVILRLLEEIFPPTLPSILCAKERRAPSNSKYNCALAHNSDARRSLGLGTRVPATPLIRVHLRLRWFVQFTEFLISPFCKEQSCQFGFFASKRSAVEYALRRRER